MNIRSNGNQTKKAVLFTVMLGRHSVGIAAFKMLDRSLLCSHASMVAVFRWIVATKLSLRGGTVSSVDGIFALNAV